MPLKYVADILQTEKACTVEQNTRSREYNITGLISDITFIVLFQPGEASTVKGNKHIHTRTHTHTHTHTHAHTQVLINAKLQIYFLNCVLINMNHGLLIFNGIKLWY